MPDSINQRIFVKNITFMTRKQRIPFPCYKQKLNIDYLISTYK